MLTRLTAVTVAALTTVALMAPTALADPGTDTTPSPEAPISQLATPEADDSVDVDQTTGTTDITDTTEVTPEIANDALATVERVLDGEATEDDPDTTQALRDLFLSRQALDGARAKKATSLLARPTDGASDPIGMGYDRRSVKRCSTTICLHWVTTGPDRPTSKAWVNKTLKVLNQVYKRTRAQGWPAPAKDGRRGGNKKLDVYLKNVGSQGIYGYCAPEKRISRQPARATAYCVLDNNFSKREFRQAPILSLKATAAHEFFHAVQFNMDVQEDVWMMESTATWMEERIFDNVNDNRQYLKNSQLKSPLTPLDTYDNKGRQYSSWLFWEFLSTRYNNAMVRKVWVRATKRGVRSTKALEQELKSRNSSLRQAVSDQIAATRYPSKFWPEGSAYNKYRATGGSFAPYTITEAAQAQPKIDHLAGLPYRLRPGAGLSASGKLRVAIGAASGGRDGLAGTVLVRSTSGSVTRYTVPIAGSGSGSVEVPFGSSVAEVVVAVTNGSPSRNNRIVNVALAPVS